MKNKKKTIAIIFALFIVSAFTLRTYYPHIKSLMNRSINAQVIWDDVNDGDYDKNPDLGHNEKLKDSNSEENHGAEEIDVVDQEKQLLDAEEKDEQVNIGDKTPDKDYKKEITGKEFRAAWVSTVYNLDWPSKKGLSQLQQKQEFISLLDGLKKAGLNSVIVQVKPSADSFYPSKYAPWSEYLTGIQGRNPGYNPLSFMIEETHRRGMEFHAWFNPYRVSVKDNKEDLAKDHPALKNSDWLVTYGGKLYYNPGIPEARQFVIDSILEVVSNYNIDGVHLDDYFYPYPEKAIDFPDDNLYKSNKRYENESKEEWRRNNINDFVENLYKSIKRVKPNVKFGVSPFGIWRNKADDPRGSNTRGGVTSYDSLHADTKYWVEKGWLDYIAPQIYWNFGYDRADYGHLVDWWADITKNHKVDLYIGHAAHKIEEGDTAWGNPLEIINQIQYNRTVPQIKGSIFFRAGSILDNPLGLMDKLEKDIYKVKARTP